MNCTLSGEYIIASETFGLSRQKLFNIAVESFKSSLVHKIGSKSLIDSIFAKFIQFAERENLLL